ncbi:MAG TPA: response regulator transcription factor [Moheibacter sp.]|nr:response regulator transcription factor [Moheibacter sp.]
MYKARILYLEDDLDLGETTLDMFLREGYFVKWVKGGLDGLKAIEDDVFDIVVADIMMPQLDGYSFLQTIREKGQQIPLIYLSARVLTEDIIKGFSIGADDYIRKPFSFDELVVRIERLLKNNIPHQSSEKETFSIGLYTFRRDTFELSWEVGKVILSPRLGEILFRFITSHDNILLRKKTLLDLWGDDSFFNGRSLDVFISKLRKQLSGDPNIKIITIRGVGYKLVVSQQ